ncbi:hypothetical protein F7725_002553 [Dissostichus mawsoni]|uniref:Rubicon Homology domain-containing protein n=1 Tax=Dissostichus mawsoni TaxID=36200 RepID=A0A7J5Y2P4_DISMA|nr:hypothetical protein F7725_002553 [Dissostichus mawsoni]
MQCGGAGRSWCWSSDATFLHKSSLEEEIRERSRRRGDLIWRPPEYKIIITVQPTLRRSEVVALQHFLVPAAGQNWSTDISRSCGIVTISAVSDFSKQLLDSLWFQPLFHLQTLNSRVKELERFREVQDQLMDIQKLLNTCRLSSQVTFDQLPAHLMQRHPFFSLDDLQRLKKGRGGEAESREKRRKILLEMREDLLETFLDSVRERQEVEKKLEISLKESQEEREELQREICSLKEQKETHGYSTSEMENFLEALRDGSEKITSFLTAQTYEQIYEGRKMEEAMKSRLEQDDTVYRLVQQQEDGRELRNTLKKTQDQLKRVRLLWFQEKNSRLEEKQENMDAAKEVEKKPEIILKEFQEEKEELQREICSLKEQMERAKEGEDAEISLKEFQEEKEELQREICSLKEQMERAKEEEKEELQREICSLKEQMERNVEEYQEEKEVLQREICSLKEQKERNVEEYQEEKEVLQREICSLKEQMERNVEEYQENMDAAKEVEKKPEISLKECQEEKEELQRENCSLKEQKERNVEGNTCSTLKQTPGNTKSEMGICLEAQRDETERITSFFTAQRQEQIYERRKMEEAMKGQLEQDYTYSHLVQQQEDGRELRNI